MSCPVASAFSHPVAAASDLGADQPLAARLLGQDWVLWRDDQGRARAATDRCPHRGTRLSLGRVCEGELQCPYHGWRFAADGRCSRIPAQPGFQPPAGHGLHGVRELVEAHGLLWLRPDGGEPNLPCLPEAGAQLRQLTSEAYDLATSAPRIVENFLDMAHFGFVHEGWLGDAEHPEVPPYEVSASAEDGVAASGCRAWQPRSTLSAAGGCWVDYDYRVPTPFSAMIIKAPEIAQGWRESIALFICPQDETRSRLWFRLAVPDTDSDDAALLNFQRTIFLQDQPVLESQQPRCLPLHDATIREVHCAADRSSTAYRRYLEMIRLDYGVC
ncbi:MAG TPA: aromatic ring-hydroxylating dioxygenase subunit alpha [Roseateles sp.]